MSTRLIPLQGLTHWSGLCWTCQTPTGCGAGDDLDNPQQSTLRLFEGGLEIGPAHSLHDDISARGGGRFSHWRDRIYLSAAAPGRRPDQCPYLALSEAPGEGAHRAVLAAAAAVDTAGLSAEMRYLWGERVFSAFVPDVKLPEFARSFFCDRQFVADYERFDRQNYRSFDRKFALKELLRLALRRSGDIAECGVYRGASAFVMARGLSEAGGGRRLHLFDSFAGLSRPATVDGGHWTSGDLACNEAEVAANLADFAELVALYPGWIPERFAEIADRRFCLVHIDVDLFQPTRDALAFFYPRMVAGGLIVCDDYGFETCPGARQAMDAFFGERLEPIVHLPTGQGFVSIEPKD